jgi:hypothetical protein
MHMDLDRWHATEKHGTSRAKTAPKKNDDPAIGSAVVRSMFTYQNMLASIATGQWSP